MPDAPDTPVTTLILTSSGGGGHITAAKAKKEEAVKAGIAEKAIAVVDLMGLDMSVAGNKDHPWIPTVKLPIAGEVFSGEANTKKWDELQKKGGMESVRALEGLVEKQWMAES